MNNTENKIADYIDEQHARRARKGERKLLKHLHKQIDHSEDGLRYMIDAKTGEIRREE